MQVESLILGGVDVNLAGKGGVTFLLWAFLSDSPDAFESLLRLGADPSLSVHPTAGLADVSIRSGDSVRDLALSVFEQNPDWISLINSYYASEIRSMRLRYKWHATDFFDDVESLAMCDAIERNAVADVERIVADGVDVNQTGKKRMTFLMWAFACHSYDVFEKLLSLGADANLPMTLSVGELGDKINIDDSVTLLAAGPEDRSIRWLESVLRHGGNVNHVHPVYRTNLLMRVARRTRTMPEALSLLLRSSSEVLNFQDINGFTAALEFAYSCDFTYGSDSWVCLAMLLEAGASADCYNDEGFQVIDLIAGRWVLHQHRIEYRKKVSARVLARDYNRSARDRVMTLLSERGYDLKSAVEARVHFEKKVHGVPYALWRHGQRGLLPQDCSGDSNVVREEPCH